MKIALLTTALLLCPILGQAATPTTVYAGSIFGLFKSANGGQTWTSIFTPPANFGGVTAVAIQPTNPLVMYVGGSSTIYKTTDGGAHWTNSSHGLPSPGANISSIVIDPSNPSTVYAGAGDLFVGGLYKSTNGGNHWQSLTSGVPLYPPPYPGSAPYVDVFALAIDPIHPKTLYLTGQTGTLTSKSTDGGSTWTPLNLAGGAGSAIAIDPVNTSTVYFSGPFGMSVTTDGGATSTPYLTIQQAGAILNVSGLAIDPSNPGTVYAGAGSTIYKSPGFTAISTVPTNQINGLIVDPANPMTIYASALDGIYVSYQGGAPGSWQLSLSTKFAWPLAMEPNAGQAAFFNLAESAIQQLISEIETSAHPVFTCNLLKALDSEIALFVQWNVLSSTQGQALTTQIQAVLQSAPCK